jgi:transcriptional regulator with XRE-family HTH domain
MAVLLTVLCTIGTYQAVIGDELRTLRCETLKLSQAKLAALLGVTVTSVARWERDERTIAELVARFVRVLAEIQTRAPSDLAARVSRVLATPQTRAPARRIHAAKRRS